MAASNVFITGASTGIGLACVHRLDQAGFKVYAGVRKAEDAAMLREQFMGRVVPVLLDVTKADDIARVRQELTEACPDGLHGLVNNAGIAVPGPLEYLTPDELRWQLEVNVVAQVAVTQAMLDLLRIPKGRIVMMSSVSGVLSAPILGAYSASKHALEAISDAWRMELARFGIEVAVVQPGQIRTPIWDKGKARAKEMEADMPQEVFERYGNAINLAKSIAESGARHGADPMLVAECVLDALTRQPRPLTRYLVGRGATPGKILSKWVPDRLRDRLLGYRYKV